MVAVATPKPPPVKPLAARELQRIYSNLQATHQKHLASRGVKLPALQDKAGGYTKSALSLIYLAKDWPNTRPVHKSELTRFIRLYHPYTNDVQEGRHLGAQKGWWVLAGGRDNIVANLRHGEYQLHSLEEPYPGFTAARRAVSADFGSIKAAYQYRCATCGSQENKPHLHWPQTKTVLQAAHMNPEKALTPANTIPQCQKCNRADGNKWVYDKKGRVVAAANYRAVRGSSRAVQRQILDWLRRELGA